MMRETMQEIAAFQQWLEHALPSYYLAFLLETQEGLHGEQVLLYGAGSLLERNDTYETQQYCPGFITIGDDSGGRAVMLALDGLDRAVYLVGHGVMQRDEFELAAGDFHAWLAADCPVD